MSFPLRPFHLHDCDVRQHLMKSILYVIVICCARQDRFIARAFQAGLLHKVAVYEYQKKEKTVGVWTAEAWTAEDVSSDVDTPNLDYKRTNNIDIYIATMRMSVVSFAFHPICV